MGPEETTYLELEDILNTIKLLLEPIERRMSAIEPFRRLLRSCASELEFAWLFFLKPHHDFPGRLCLSPLSKPGKCLQLGDKESRTEQ